MGTGYTWSRFSCGPTDPVPCCAPRCSGRVSGARSRPEAYPLLGRNGAISVAWDEPVTDSGPSWARACQRPRRCAPAPVIIRTGPNVPLPPPRPLRQRDPRPRRLRLGRGTCTRGAPEAIAELRGAGKTVAFVTNDARRSPEEYVRKLWSLGLQASLEEVVTVGARDPARARRAPLRQRRLRDRLAGDLPPRRPTPASGS